MVLTKYADGKILAASTDPVTIADLITDTYMQYALFKIKIYLNGELLDSIAVPNLSKDKVLETIELMKKCTIERND